MSTNYDLNEVGFDFDALKTEGPKIGLIPEDNIKNNADSQCYCFQDESYVWAYRCADNSTSFCTFGMNNSDGVDALADAIGAICMDEHELGDGEVQYTKIVKTI